MRYDRPASNREIAERLKMVREQIDKLYDQISFIEAMTNVEEPDEQFKHPIVKDRITTIAIAVKNNAAEMDKLWKLTRQ